MELQKARGVRDFLPEEKIIRQRIVDILRSTFELYGFNPLETPALERYDVLSSKYAGGSEILKETFKLKDQANRKLGLRYDLTVPLARVIGMNPQLKMPFKRYQIGRVWRDGPIKLGRVREFWQADVDVVGVKGMLADAEILAVVCNVVEKLGLKFFIKINNRKLLDGILDFCNVEENKRMQAILAIDKLAKFGVESVKKELKEKGIAKDVINKIIKIIDTKGTNKEILDKLKKFLISKESIEGIKELEELLDYCKNFGVKNIELDISLARGLVFYTGTVFEVFLKQSEIKSSIAGGGRFDKIIGKFLGIDKEYPAVGISFGLDVIANALKLTKRVKEKKSVIKVYVIPIKTVKESLKITQKLRKNGIKADMDLMDRGISKNLNYANRYGIPFVIFVGGKELKQRKVKLRDMKSGKESLLTLDSLIKKIKKEFI